MRKLPLDTSTFSRLRNLNYVYVDKTEYIYKMITGGHRFFLSRPRRFGKSLLVSTMKEILTNNKQLFDDLWIAQSDYTWIEYGVINFDFSQLAADNLLIFEESLKNALLFIAENYEITINPSINNTSDILQSLAFKLFKRFGHVALLVDEYDSPILKTMHNEELSKAIRDKIQQFFTTIKGLDEQISFAFFTGVSSFAKAGLFSGINNVQILTLHDEYAGICGYTDQEVDYYFADYIADWAKKENKSYHELRQDIKTWYNGYQFGENVTRVYNPFSLMNALRIQKFENFWFQSGTPKFLIEVLKKDLHSFDPEKLTTSKDSLGIFDVGKTPLITLMFQAGYLTIVDYNPNLKLYTLDYPNEEVRISFQKYLLEIFAHVNPNDAERVSLELKNALNYQKIDTAIELLKQLFAHVPYQLHMKEEKYYHSLFMMICIGAGIKAQSEYSTNLGRIDLILEFEKIIYVIEVKFNKPAEEALAQIEELHYYDRFIPQNKKIILLGLGFQRKPKHFDITYAIKQL